MSFVVSLVIVFLVELLLDNGPGECFLAYLDLNGVAQTDTVIDESNGTALVDRYKSVTGSYFADFFTVFKYLVTMAWHGMAFQLNSFETATHAIGFLLCESLFSYELVLIKLAEHGETGHNRRDVGTEFVAVEGQADFETQRVTAAQSAGLAAVAGHEFVPRVANIAMRTLNFKTVLASVSCTRDYELLAFGIDGLCIIENKFAAVKA